MDNGTSKIEGYEFWTQALDLHDGTYAGQVNFVRAPHIADPLDPPHSMRLPQTFRRMEDAHAGAHVFAEAMISTNALKSLILAPIPKH